METFLVMCVVVLFMQRVCVHPTMRSIKYIRVAFKFIIFKDIPLRFILLEYKKKYLKFLKTFSKP